MECPICKESIKDGAKKCIHCLEWIPEEPKEPVRSCPLCLFWKFINHTRFGAFLLYVIAWIVLLAFFFNKKPEIPNFPNDYTPQILWCFCWGAFGIAAGLWNSRSAKGGVLDRWWHYVFYFGFVLVITALAAFVAFEINKANPVLSYAAAALTGLIVGFAGDSLIEKFFSLVQ
ncbi:MAG: hypothetical protein PHU54_04220 [Candidatus Omnitrophica bacterium]|jgi:hypothetical protein|nr:hypothetical protein [Candidatus Omnitrophota bacterium]